MISLIESSFLSAFFTPFNIFTYSFDAFANPFASYIRFELMGLVSQLTEAGKTMLATFHAALDLYRKADFVVAEQKFNEVLAMAPQDGPALGAQAGEKRLRDILEKGGFAKIRRAAETPFNMVLEAR